MLQEITNLFQQTTKINVNTNKYEKNVFRLNIYIYINENTKVVKVILKKQKKSNL